LNKVMLTEGVAERILVLVAVGHVYRMACWGIPLPCGQLFGSGNKLNCKQGTVHDLLGEVCYHILDKKSAVLVGDLLI